MKISKKNIKELKEIANNIKRENYSLSEKEGIKSRNLMILQQILYSLTGIKVMYEKKIGMQIIWEKPVRTIENNRDVKHKRIVANFKDVTSNEEAYVFILGFMMGLTYEKEYEEYDDINNLLDDVNAWRKIEINIAKKVYEIIKKGHITKEKFRAILLSMGLDVANWHSFTGKIYKWGEIYSVLKEKGIPDNHIALLPFDLWRRIMYKINKLTYKRVIYDKYKIKIMMDYEI